MIAPTDEAPARLTLFTAREAAAYLRISLSTLRRLERQGRLTPLRTPGGHRRFSLEQLNACLSQYPGRSEAAAA